MNFPVPIEVVEDEDGRPVTLALVGQDINITSIDDLWEISDEWWRPKSVTRRYYQVTTEDGRSLIVFRDLVYGGWYRQRG